MRARIGVLAFSIVAASGGGAKVPGTNGKSGTVDANEGDRGADPCDTVGVIRSMEMGVARGCD